MYVFVSGGVGGEGVRGLGFGFTNLVGTGGVLDVCLVFGLLCCGWYNWGVGRGLGPGSGGGSGVSLCEL